MLTLRRLMRLRLRPMLVPGQALAIAVRDPSGSRGVMILPHVGSRRQFLR
jgi:hypothetical protein